MKDHISTIAMLVALALLLIVVSILALSGSKADGPLLIGLGGAVSTITGAIAGKQISNLASNTTTSTSTSSQTSPEAPK